MLPFDPQGQKPDLKDEIYELTYGHVPVFYDADIFASTNAPKLWPKNVDNELRLRFGESNALHFERILLNFVAMQKGWILLYHRWLDFQLNFITAGA